MEITFDPEKSAEYRRRGWWRDTLFTDDLRAQAARTPDKVAIVSQQADRARPEVLSYAQLTRLVDRFAGALLDMGVKPGDVVSFQLPNWWQVPTLAFAAMRIGAVVNPILPILRRREVRYIIERVQPAVVITPDAFRGFAHGQMLADIAAETIGLDRLVVIGDDVPDGALGFDEKFVRPRWEERCTEEMFDEIRPEPDALAQIQFTSGTTGEPKGVMHTHNTLHAGVVAMVDTYDLNSDDVVLMASTMAHQTGYLYGALMPAVSGMKVVYLDVWDARTMLHSVEEESVTWTMGATPFVVDAVEAAGSLDVDLSTLAIFVTAGAAIPPALIERASESLGTELHAVWGMTENGAVTFTRRGDSKERRASSDGRAWDGMELKVVDPDDRHELPAGEVGSLLARGAAQSPGYFKRPELRAATVDDEGWFDTGDLAYMHEDGYIRISGRIKDLVIRGGENIPVFDIESLLFEHPKVAEVVVVGRPDERLGERACAVVVPKGDAPELPELVAYLEERGMAKHFWPEFLEIVEELPRTASGKVQKFRVRQEILGDNT